MSAPAIVSIVRGPDFECEFSNLAHRQLFGDRNLLGVPASSLGATPEILAMFERARSTGQPIAASEYPILGDWRGDGKRERRFFNFTAEPLRDPTGKIDELLWFAIDVTDQVLAREAAEKAARERARLLESERTARTDAEIANRAKDDFLATVSHELRTPLNAILGWTVVARRQAPKELERALGIIERNARAQTRIIEDVLDVSRIVGGKLRLDIAGRPTWRRRSKPRSRPCVRSRRRGASCSRPTWGPSGSSPRMPDGSSRWSGTSCRTRSSSRPRAAASTWLRRGWGNGS